MIHIIYSSEEKKYILLDPENTVVDRADTHEEAMLMADKHEALDYFKWSDICLLNA